MFMKNRNYFLAFLVIILQPCTLSYAQIPSQAPNYGWPVKTDDNSYHTGTITGTPGEYRNPYSGTTQTRFHKGVDITGNGTNVYSIEAGTHTIHLQGASGTLNRRILINGTIYWHVQETVGFVNGITQVSSNQQIGEMYQATG